MRNSPAARLLACCCLWASLHVLPAQRAYIPNSLGNTVSVIDLTGNAVIATIPVGTNPNGICFSPDGGRAYVNNTGSDDVSVINTAT